MLVDVLDELLLLDLYELDVVLALKVMGEAIDVLVLLVSYMLYVVPALLLIVEVLDVLLMISLLVLKDVVV